MEAALADDMSLAQIDQRIAILRDNIRQLIEQSAAYSGAADEDLNADRLNDQQDELNRLLKQRAAMTK
ncbi:MAG: hypothetical protein KIT85_02130 [Pseudolabrys sp.]|nr:hypothetical protein [Pseudolabrys sp.]MCW5683165.1 hypothetical protein [Pseudolabrys sp.]